MTVLDPATFPLGALGIGSGWALVGLCVVLIFRGVLVTRREADAYREEARETRKALDEALRQNTVLLEQGRLVSSTFRAIRDEADE